MRPTSLITLSCALFLIALAAPQMRVAAVDITGANVGDEHLAGGRRHGNNAYMKAASEERDKLLNTQLKSICRGC